MLETNRTSRLVTCEADSPCDQGFNFLHPEDVLQSVSLSVAEKRALLAAWASDAHAVPNAPAMRQLQSGAIVSVDSILAALRELDTSETAKRVVKSKLERSPLSVLYLLPRFPRRHDDDDDDDPPPSPAGALPPLVERDWGSHRDKALQLAAA